MRKTPPDILITTPESLYLMLSSGVREILATTEAVIVDEIHAVAQTKRGSHLALTLERLEQLVGVGEGSPSNSGEAPPSPPRPPGPADRALGHAAAAGADRPVPRRPEAGVQDRRCGAEEGARSGDRRAGRGHGRPGRARLPHAEGSPARSRALAHVRSIWPAIYPKLLELVQEHTSTIIFVNNRRASERLAKRLNELANGEGEQELPATEHGGHARRRLRRAAAGEAPAERTPLRAARRQPRRTCGDRPGPPRLPLPRGADSRRGDAEVRAAAVPRGHLLAGAGDRHGGRRPGDPGRVAEVGDPRPAADRPRRARARRGLPRAGSSPNSAATCSSARSSPGGCAKARSRRR